MQCANDDALVSGAEAQQIDAIPSVVSCCLRTLSNNMKSLILFKDRSCSPYVTNTILKVISDLDSRICFSLYLLLFHNVARG